MDSFFVYGATKCMRFNLNHLNEKLLILHLNYESVGLQNCFWLLQKMFFFYLKKIDFKI